VIVVFLPAYNEEDALGRLVGKFDAEIRKTSTPYRIVVLDDGSSDKTAAVAQELSKKYPLELLRHVTNQGLGRTIIDGFGHVSKTTAPEDCVITMDCDDTHDPKYIHAALAKIAEGFDVVILSRYKAGGGERGLSVIKSFLSFGAGLFLKFFFPIRGVREYSCGYRVLKASVLHKAHEVFGDRFVEFPHLGFVVTPEILIKFRMLGCRITEVPFVLQYDQKVGKSKNKPWRTIPGYFALVLRYWGRKA
jgi:dolichol-phosphate mannosyltransferase